MPGSRDEKSPARYSGRDPGLRRGDDEGSGLTNESYMSGFGNHFATEAESGALPQGRNSPQKPPFGLYAEQVSGTAFTAPRADNRRSWLYRLRPSAEHPPYRRYEGAPLFAPGAAPGP